MKLVSVAWVVRFCKSKAAKSKMTSKLAVMAAPQPLLSSSCCCFCQCHARFWTQAPNGATRSTEEHRKHLPCTH